MLIFNGDDSPESLTAIDKNGGAALASINLPSASLVGGAYHEARGTVFTIDFTGTDLVREISPRTGVELNSFSPISGAFGDINFGGIDVIAASGNLLAVSDQQDIIRELTFDGTVVRDIDLAGLTGFGGQCGMSGISIDQASGNVWLSCTFGEVYELADLNVPVPSEVPLPAAAPMALAAFGGLDLLARRKR